MGNPLNNQSFISRSSRSELESESESESGKSISQSSKSNKKQFGDREIHATSVENKTRKGEILFKQLPIYNRETKEVEVGTYIHCSNISESDIVENDIDYRYQMYNLKINDAIISLSNSFKEAKNNKINGRELVSWMKENINFLGKVKLNINGESKQLLPLEEPDIEYFRGLDQENTNKFSKSLSTVLNNFYEKSFTNYNYNRMTRAEKLREYKSKQGRDITLADRIKVTIPFGNIYVSENKDMVDHSRPKDSADAQSGLKESADAQSEQENITGYQITSTKSLADEQKEQLDYQSEVEGDANARSKLEESADVRISSEESTSSLRSEQLKMEVQREVQKLQEMNENLENLIKKDQEVQPTEKHVEKKEPGFFSNPFKKLGSKLSKKDKKEMAATHQLLEEIRNIDEEKNKLEEQIKRQEEQIKVVKQQEQQLKEQQHFYEMQTKLQLMENISNKNKDLIKDIKMRKQLQEEEIEDQQSLKTDLSLDNDNEIDDNQKDLMTFPDKKDISQGALGDSAKDVQTNSNIVEGVSIDVGEFDPLNTSDDFNEFVKKRALFSPSISPQSRIDNSKSNFDSNMANLEIIIDLDL